MKKAYVFFNGELCGSLDFYKNILINDPGDIFCADGGAKHLIQLGIYPKEIWGDFDSVDVQVINDYKNNHVLIKKFPIEKDKTDGELLLDYVSGLGYDNICIIGGLGGRTDHLLSNLLLLFKYDNLEFLSEKEIIIKAVSDTNYGKYLGCTISFIPFSEKIESLTLSGFKYSLINGTLDQGDTLCMSNIVTDKKCKIKFTKGKMICIININSLIFYI